MLVTMKPILEAAKKGGYCVAAPNFFDYGMLLKAIEAAEELRSPVILDIVHRGDTDAFITMANTAAELARKATVPVALNLDHGAEFYKIVDALWSGCSSVMVDRSYLPYDENVKQVSEVVRIAHNIGKSVEAELGHVGTNGKEGDKLDESHHLVLTDEDKRKTYTKVDEAITYVKETEVDCLAVAVGTVHGLYPKGFKPSVDFELLAQLRDAVDVPLVIHGGSGSGDEILSKIGPNGGCKLNVGSDLVRCAREALDKAYAEGNPADPIGAYYNGYKEELKHYMTVLGCAGKAE